MREVVTGVERWSEPPGSDLQAVPSAWAIPDKEPTMAAGTLLSTYLSRFGFPTDGISLETVGFAAALDAVARVEPIIAESILQEVADERSHLKLIASENFASPAVLLAMGNWLSDKYAEGAPGHRLYAGCDNVDTIEARVDELACTLFGADHTYAQPHSGIDANLVAFWAVLSQRVEAPALDRRGLRHVNDLSDEDWKSLRQELGNQTLLGMSLHAGGHLTHGFRPNISGKLFRHRSYGVDSQTSLLDYDEVRRRAHEERPLILAAGYSSPGLINFRVDGRSRTKSTRRSWSTWPISRAWSQAECSRVTTTLFPTPTS